MTVVVKAILGPWGQQPVEGVPGSHEASAEVKIPVRCRTARQSFLFGFVDHDGVAGIAAAIAPRLANAKAKANAKANAQAPEFSRAPVVLSLSGVGASPASHADAHKHKTSPGAPFLFGLSKAWILVPARAGPHNWEGTGILSAWAALRALESFASSHPSFRPANGTASRPGVDTNRIVYLGHSRGGHGALTLSLRHPDSALAVAPIAGWMSREVA